MISKHVLLEYSKAFSLNADVIEKDYVLSWILAGIYHNPRINTSWIFKGGTCLKKCYFETYRFSEDLDFTLLDPLHIEESFLKNVMREISLWVRQESGIELPGDHIDVEIFTNPRGKISSQCKMGYIGPLQRRSNIPKIKFDLSSDEALVLEPINREIYHPYPDKLNSGMDTLCYSFEEVFAEKIRALYERSRPRDLYDVIHLYRNRELITDLGLLFSILKEKCAYKGIDLPTYELLNNHPLKGELSAEWSNMLSHQIATLPELDNYWNELPLFFDWLYDKKIAPEPLHVEVEIGSERWSQGRLIELSPQSSFIDRIQFAASNRLCISLTYSGKIRTIESYSFRRSRAGAILFYGYERESGKIKCFRVDKFESVNVINETYEPRYAVEITSAGIIHMPKVRRRIRF